MVQIAIATSTSSPSAPPCNYLAGMIRTRGHYDDDDDDDSESRFAGVRRQYEFPYPVAVQRCLVNLFNGIALQVRRDARPMRRARERSCLWCQSGPVLIYRSSRIHFSTVDHLLNPILRLPGHLETGMTFPI